MSDPMSLHNYLYAHGNPVNAIDPSGLSTLSIGSQLDLIFAVGALAAIALPVVSTVFKFIEGTPNEFPPEPPPFPVPRPSEPEILINKPPAGEFPPSPEPFPVPNPEKPEPLITRVPLLGLKEYLDNYVFSAICNFSPRKLQHEYKHAPDFGITGNWNSTNRALFIKALEDHIQNAPVQIQGTYRGTIPVTHYYDPNTEKWVAVDLNNDFVAAWKLSNAQRDNLLNGGNVQ